MTPRVLSSGLGGWLFTSRSAAQDAGTDSMAALSASTSLIEVTLNLAFVLAAIVLLAWIVKRVQGLDQPASGALRITATLPLGPKERLLIVEVGNQQLLLGASTAGINTLHVLDTPVYDTAQEAVSFRTRLLQTLKGAAT